MSIIGTMDVRNLLFTITPALASSSDVELTTLVGTHHFDTKLDGIRALAAYDAEGLTLRNRNGRNITDNFPDLQATAQVLPHPVILDGEIVAIGGAFQDIARRDKLSKPFQIAQAATAHPAAFVAFDVLWAPGIGDVRHLPYIARRIMLGNLHLDGPHWATTVASADPALYETIKAAGGEGVIAKRLTTPYATGRTSSWQKFKTTQSVTCVAIGYENGSGKREFMGAILLAMLSPQGVTLVGKAGSGFTDRTAREMKAALDHAGETRNPLDLPIVEIECLSRTRDNKLRQPIFKGVRTDQTLADATITQLEGLPQT